MKSLQKHTLAELSDNISFMYLFNTLVCWEKDINYPKIIRVYMPLIDKSCIDNPGVVRMVARMKSEAQMPGRRMTKGLSLDEYLAATGTSYSAFSRALGVHASYPRMLAQGLARPSYELAVRIEEATEGNVLRTEWYPPNDNTEEQSSVEDLPLE